ncbi:MAG: hypothetical protein J2P18_01415 [Nocardia sp.]|nr:hypothetical protein [Nocardia sp.]
MAVLSIPFSIDAHNEGSSGRVWLGVGVGLVGVTSVIVGLPLLQGRRRRLPRDIGVGSTTNGAHGLSIYYLRVWRISLGVWLAAGFVFLVIRGVTFGSEMFSGDGDSVSFGLTGAGIIGIIVVLAMVVVLGYHLLASRHRRGRVALTVEGLIQSNGRITKTVAWSSVGGVSACLVNNVRSVRITPVPQEVVAVDVGGSWLGKLQRGTLERSIDVPVWVLGLDPAMFLHLVQFYWRHQEFREELLSDAVIDRMRRGEVVD